MLCADGPVTLRKTLEVEPTVLTIWPRMVSY